MFSGGPYYYLVTAGGPNARIEGRDVFDAWLNHTRLGYNYRLDELSAALGLAQHDATLEYIVDLIVEVQTVRTCLTAAEVDPQRTPQGYCIPGRAHIAVGSIAMQK